MWTEKIICFHLMVFFLSLTSMPSKGAKSFGFTFLVSFFSIAETIKK